MTDLFGTSVVSNGKLDWAIMRNQLDYVNKMAMHDMLNILRTAKQLDREQARLYLTDAFEALVNTYGGVSAEMTAAWWNEIVADELYDASPAYMPTYEQLTTEVRWGMSTNAVGRIDVTSRMAMLLQKHIFGASRNTIDLNALNTGVKYARVAQPDACSFCRVLASRGAVYGSEAAALFVGMAGVKKHYSDGKEKGTRFKKGRVRGVLSAGSKYHDHCACIAAPAGEGVDMNYPDYFSDFENDYNAARVYAAQKYPGETLDMKLITKAMREQGVAA